MAAFINTMSVPISFPRAPGPHPAPNPLISPSISYTPLTHDPASHLSSPAEGSSTLTHPSNARTKAPFKPRSTTRGTSSFHLRQFAEDTLGSQSLRKVVQLPEGEDLNEWLAVNGGLAPSRLKEDRVDGHSCRLRQPDQPPLWIHYRVLFAAVVSGDEGYG